MPESRSVLVIGAGIVGISTALRLRRHGLNVTVIDRNGAAGGASFGNAGILATCAIVPVPTPEIWRKLPGWLVDPLRPVYLRWQYLPRMLPWLWQYLSNARIDKVQRISGHIAAITADSLDEHRALAEGTPAAACIRPLSLGFVYRNRIDLQRDWLSWQLRRDHGFRWRVLEDAEVAAAEPELSTEYRCLVDVEEQHAIIDDPGTYVKLLARQLEREGGVLKRASVRALYASDTAITGVALDNGQTLPAETVVVACGAWSGRLLQTVGIRVPLEAERGYHIELYGVSTRLNRALIITTGEFAITPMSGKIRLAGLVEFGGLDAAPSAAPIHTLLTRTRQLLPALRYSEHTEWLGHRPTTPDSLPIIGESQQLRGLHLAFGHQHIGLTSGPLTGRLVADQIANQKINQDLSAYRLERFTQNRAWRGPG